MENENTKRNGYDRHKTERMGIDIIGITETHWTSYIGDIDIRYRPTYNMGEKWTCHHKLSPTRWNI